MESRPRFNPHLKFVMAATLALAGAPMAYAAIKSWNTGNGAWFTSGHWTPNGVPALNDVIRIGDLPGAQNSTVLLGAPGAGYSSLEVSDGMTLDLNNGELVSFGLAEVIGTGSRLIVRPAAGPNLYDFQGVLLVGPGAFFDLRDNAPVRLFGEAVNEGTVLGRGSLLINSSDPFRNDGTIRPGTNGGLVITQGAAGDQPIDLDGYYGQSVIDLADPFSSLEVNAGSLDDWFNGDINMVQGTLLTMNISDGWTVNSAGNIHVSGANNPNAAAQIAGEMLTFDGDLSVGPAQGHLRMLADLTLLNDADVDLSDTAWLESDGATTIADARFELGQNAQLDFDGQTTIQSGEFTTYSTDPANGSVDFNGSTTWNGGGPVAINGVARQMGNAFVNGPMVINGDVFDMDGDGDTQWTIWNNLTINADLAEAPDAYDTFTGTLNIASTAGKLTVNVQPEHWDFHMSGVMNLIGHPAVYHTRYAGDTLTLHGELNASGKVASEAYIWAYEGAVSVADPNATLRLDGGCIIGLDCAISGDGEIRVGPDAPLKALFPLANFGGVGLLNDGRMGAPGGAFVDRFEQTGNGTWGIFLRGYDVDDNDFLSVTGGDAILSGTLEVDQYMFAPVLGDEFTILTATGNVIGTFDEIVGVGCDLGQSFQWTAIYDAHTVTLRLDEVDLLPGDMTCDCDIDGRDIQPFVVAVLDPAAHAALYSGCDIMHGDINADGYVDIDDVGPFVELLMSIP